ncbi:uncharacterized protein [Asterias amurensis]|uniref:uncharacterized protein n=1 Tax=Asterias amurensis TaxID=7602 RepID=UPI003AB51B7D
MEADGIDQLGAEIEDFEPASSSKPHKVFYTSGRRLDRFRGKPEKTTDPSILERVSDVTGQIAARELKGKDAVAFVIDHLAGKARQEILGRGSCDDPEAIFKVLLKVFGDGNTLPQLQQKFFSYCQGPNDDLLTCSLELVELFNSMVRLDESFSAVRQKTLKGRLAEAVTDEGLKRELRRLNIDSPALSFFDARDRAIEWLGTTHVSAQKVATVQEVKAASPDVRALLEMQSKQLQQQQQQINTLIKALNGDRPRPRWSQQNPRRCYNCQSPGHLQRNCPHPSRSNNSPSERGQQSQFNPSASPFPGPQTSAPKHPLN